MKSKSKSAYNLLILLTFFLIVVFSFGVFRAVDEFHGDARKVNLAGLIRGKSQRMVKQELAGKGDERLIEEIQGHVDDLNNMTPGKDNQYLSDPSYMDTLEEVTDGWEHLKELALSGDTPENMEKLYTVSEEFFEDSNRLVYLIEKIAESKVDSAVDLRTIVFVLYLVMIFLFANQYFKGNDLLRKNENLKEKATIDQMTGINNRWACDLKIAEYKEMKKLNDTLCISMDLNNLKYANDNFGHTVGDKMIVGFAHILRDAVGEKGFVGRNGGDEFIAFIDKFSRSKEEVLTKEMDLKIAKWNEENDPGLMSVSYGSVLSTELPGRDIFEMMNLSDKLMYEDKKKKKESNPLAAIKTETKQEQS